MRHKNKIVFFMIFILWNPFPLFANDTIEIDIEDFTACDPIFCPKESKSSSDSEDQSNTLTPGDRDARRIGIQKNTFNVKLPSLRTILPNLPKRKLVLRQINPTGRVTTQTQETGLKEGTESPTAQPTETANRSQQEPENQPQRQTQNGSPLSSRITKSRLGGSISRISGQNSQITSRSGANSHMTNPALMMNRENKVGINNTKNERSGNDRGQAFRPPSSPQGPSPANSSGHSPERGKKKKSLFSRIATQLGFGKYFGSSGNQRRNRRYNQRNHSRQRNNKRQTQKSYGGQLKTPSDILKERFNKQFKRGLANSLEFETSRTSLFQKMCEHYNNYTRKHNIPDSRKHCPK